MKKSIGWKGYKKMGRRKKADIEADFQHVIPAYFSKDNNLISSKSKMTLLGRKVFDVAIMHVEEGVSEEGMPEVHSIIYGQELKEFMGRKGNSLYKQISDLIDPKPTKGKAALKPSLLDWRIIIKDDEKQEIDAKNVIQTASFKNGKLTIVFNNQLKKNLIGYKNNYTMLNRDIISKFHSNYSYQLYQIFKKTIDRQRALTKEDGLFELKMDLADLKIQLGLVEAKENDVLYEAVINDSVNTYDELSKIQDKELIKRIKEYGNFRIYALEPAKKEINELSDIEMDFEPITGGLGGDTKGVKFFIKYKDVIDTPPKEKVEPEIDVLDFIDEMRDKMTVIKFTSKELKSIAETASYDMNKVMAAYDVLINSSTEVEKPVGFMIQAIKENYSASKKSYKGKTKKPAFMKYEQQTIDFEDLEEKFLDN